MSMFSKVIAFLDKAAGVPLWITHADNVRKLEERGCPSLARAIVEKSSFEHMAPYTIGQIAQHLAEDYRGVDASSWSPDLREFSRNIVLEVIGAIEGPVEGPLQVLYDFVGKDIPSVEIVDVEVVLTDPVDTSMAEIVEVKEEVATTSEDTLAAATSTEEIPAPVLDPHVRAQLIHGMTKVISRGRKVAPTLKVLNTMSGGDRAAIIEALSLMEAKGNGLAKAILEDPSL